VTGRARFPRRPGALALAGALLGLVGAGALLGLAGGGTPVATGRGGDADADPPGRIALGREVYDLHCAACHGAGLEGAPDWRTPLPSGRLPAPPHDATGHTWHHPDAVLFRIVRGGTAAFVGGGYESDMPGFGGVLSDAEIEAVLAYIRSTWPERERRFQREVTRADEAARTGPGGRR
jgi:mono/diheme cytochrome c family protein